MLLWITAAIRCAECMGVKSNKWSMRPIPILTHFLPLALPLPSFSDPPTCAECVDGSGPQGQRCREDASLRSARLRGRRGEREGGRTASNLITHYVARASQVRATNAKDRRAGRRRGRRSSNEMLAIWDRESDRVCSCKCTLLADSYSFTLFAVIGVGNFGRQNPGDNNTNRTALATLSLVS